MVVNNKLRIVKGSGTYTGMKLITAQNRAQRAGSQDPRGDAQWISSMTGDDGKLTPSNRKAAIRILMTFNPEMTQKVAASVVDVITDHIARNGGSFWDTLADIGTSIVKGIPVVGGWAAEGINSLRTGKAYNAKKAALDSGLSLIPGPVGTVARAGLSLSGLDKKITGGKATKAQIKSYMEKTGLSYPEVVALLGTKKLGSGCGSEEAPKRTRKVSEKEKRRGNLISTLMAEHGMTFGDASHFIKENHVEY